MEILGIRLKELRDKKDLTQQEIAEKLNINRVTYHGYETNKHLPDLPTLIKIADVFQTSLDYLTGRYN